MEGKLVTILASVDARMSILYVTTDETRCERCVELTKMQVIIVIIVITVIIPDVIILRHAPEFRALIGRSSGIARAHGRHKTILKAS